MIKVVSNLDEDDLVSVAAYLASREPQGRIRRARSLVGWCHVAWVERWRAGDNPSRALTCCSMKALISSQVTQTSRKAPPPEYDVTAVAVGIDNAVGRSKLTHARYYWARYERRHKHSTFHFATLRKRRHPQDRVLPRRRFVVNTPRTSLPQSQTQTQVAARLVSF
jgi:hypothetical protein